MPSLTNAGPGSPLRESGPSSAWRLDPVRPWAREILHVWFHRLSPRDWFGSAREVDAMLRRRFAGDLARMGNRPPREFLEGPRTALAAVLLFDQVPRNLHGGNARAFAHDPLAAAICNAALDRGWDAALSFEERQFLAMPLMHSEDILDQQRALRVFARLPRRCGWPWAVDHARMIARFGRFPHRNKALGRKSTPAEKRAVEAGFAW